MRENIVITKENVEKSCFLILSFKSLLLLLLLLVLLLLLLLLFLKEMISSHISLLQ
ncbi:hypothetical protein ACMBCM_04705 [Spiroplasma sp. K1]